MFPANIDTEHCFSARPSDKAAAGHMAPALFTYRPRR